MPSAAQYCTDTGPLTDFLLVREFGDEVFVRRDLSERLAVGRNQLAAEQFSRSFEGLLTRRLLAVSTGVAVETDRQFMRARLPPTDLQRAREALFDLVGKQAALVDAAASDLNRGEFVNYGAGDATVVAIARANNLRLITIDGDLMKLCARTRVGCIDARSLALP